MSIITAQKISTYYDQFKTVEVTFSKEIIQVSGLVPQQVHLKCGGDFWSCVVYSASFQGAKLAINIQSGLTKKLQITNNSVSLRLCFKKPDKDAPVAFFIAGRITGFTPYNDSKEIALFTLQFTQRPPDDLIEIMGRILDANVNSVRRKEDRIALTDEAIRKMGLLSTETAAFIQGVPRRCILRDISFSGAKIIMLGISKFLDNREMALRVDFDDPRESFIIKGVFVRSELVEGRKELLALVIQFKEHVPVGYNIRLNEYLSTKVETKSGRESREQLSTAPAAPAAAAPAAAAAAQAAAAAPTVVPAAPVASPAKPEAKPKDTPAAAPAAADAPGESASKEEIPLDDFTLELP